MTTPNFFDDFLSDNPDILYQARRPRSPRAGRGGNFLDYWRGRQGDVYQEYLGGIGRTAMSGQVPTQTFNSYLDDYDWDNYWTQLSPGRRGSRSSRFAPRIKYTL
jgi:hypothetical protein